MAAPNPVQEFKPREATSSLDPYVFDDDLIPYHGTCCTVDSCFLRSPDCIGGHGKGVYLFENHEFTCFKPGRTDDEYCIWTDGLFSCVKPTHCCKGASQVFCLDSRAVFVDFAKGKPLDENFPCLCNILGFTIAYNWMWTPMCCATWAQIKAATGSPIMGTPAPANAPAPASGSAPIAVATPAQATPVEESTEVKKE